MTKIAKPDVITDLMNTNYHTISKGDYHVEGIKRFLKQQQLFRDVMDKINFTGKRVLDIGCRDGMFSFEAEEKGASEVIGIDVYPNDKHIAPMKSKIKMYPMSVYALNPEAFGLFDIVLFSGVLYHLRFPFLAIKNIRNILKDDGVMLLETAIYTRLNKMPMLYCPIGKESPYESSSVTFFNRKGLIDSLSTLRFSTFEYTRLKPHSIHRIDRAAMMCKPTGVYDEDTSKYWRHK